MLATKEGRNSSKLKVGLTLYEKKKLINKI